MPETDGLEELGVVHDALDALRRKLRLQREEEFRLYNHHKERFHELERLVSKISETCRSLRDVTRLVVKQAVKESRS